MTNHRSLAFPVEWTINIPILKNPLLWFQLMIVALLSGSFLILLLAGLNLFESHWEQIPYSFTVGISVGVGLFATFALILVLLYHGGVPTRYILRDGYIEQHTLTRAKRAGNFLGMLGLLSGKSAGMTAAGSTLLARSREQIAVKWKSVDHIEVYPDRHEIRILDGWHTVMQIISPADQFDDVLQVIQEKTQKNGRQKKFVKNREMPVGTKLILSILSLIFGFLLFPRLPIHYVGLFTIVTILFALLSLWSGGLKQRIYGAILLALPIVGVIMAFYYGEVDMTPAGSIYALGMEVLFLGYFLWLGARTFFKGRI